LRLGYLICGVPYWALLTLATAVCGLLPMGGTALVWIPVAIYLVIQFGWGAAILLIAWSTIAVVIIDNFIKPVAMRHGTELPTLALSLVSPADSMRSARLGFFSGRRLLRFSRRCLGFIAVPTCATKFRKWMAINPGLTTSGKGTLTGSRCGLIPAISSVFQPET
jgi:AI-2E family transporter